MAVSCDFCGEIIAKSTKQLDRGHTIGINHRKEGFKKFAVCDKHFIEWQDMQLKWIEEKQKKEVQKDA